jgi:diguanylate cyclase (GGDEF)-like protein/PAS domain S-box-containing protein
MLLTLSILWLIKNNAKKGRFDATSKDPCDFLVFLLKKQRPSGGWAMRLRDLFPKRREAKPADSAASTLVRLEGRAKKESGLQDIGLLQRIAETSPVGIVVANLGGQITFANSQAATILGLSKSEMTRRSCIGPEWHITDFYGRTLPEDRLPFGRVMSTGRPVYDVQYAVERPDGRRVFLSMNAAPLFDARGRVDGLVAVILDITERKQAEEKLRYVSTHDTLTGLYNRAYFEEAFDRLGQDGYYPLSVIVADLDGLKAVNDSQGHTAGDDLLRRTGQVLQTVFRSEDVAARIGGDEFAVWLPATDCAAARAALGRLRIVLAHHNRRAQGVPLRLSLGLATGKRDCSLSQILKEADQSLYSAKQTRPKTAKPWTA